ncbi:class I SAM-dependent methyltransferase [Nonomuraea zeae]|uniref:Class I SAM-dependent methyltransferase n=1 Tax=Nonomuraea zeae TaxID=1642303 RepID=A0A5S4GMS3_9ACTN|nr:class I SAM-dependent methyltransferase [Nonomuraea zeae]TMR33881.1 class I SAM-dependent methyltransferase [Nonomuraea zeae]
MGYAELIQEGLTAPFEGWDFTAFTGRLTYDGSLPWDYDALVRDRLPGASALLDLGTGGGERLASLALLPSRTAATEGHPPNVPIARARLEPLGVEVAEARGALPFPDGSFDLIVNRHESYDPHEVRRVLAAGGTFVTQQVAGRDLGELNRALGGPPHDDHDWGLAAAVAGLTDAGLTVTWSQSASYSTIFRDIGALVLFLRVVPWQVPDFDPETYGDRLRALHEDMERGRPLTATAHRFALTAR